MTTQQPRSEAERHLSDLDRVLGEQLERFATRVADATVDVAERFRPVLDGMTRDAEAVRRLAATTRDAAGDAWRSIAARAESAYRLMTARISTELGRMEEELGASGEEYRRFVRDRSDELKGIVDQLRVQAELARMETDDRVSGLLDAARDAYAGLERAVAGEDDRDVGARLSGLFDDFGDATGKAMRAVIGGGQEESS
jgi:ABC-type transporter Mla subunit MlaD